ncbi:MAG: molybdopterin-dependent oxidoreductase [Anaerolineae bacterium]|nr:molybdopterin-dependent oxidoreductase [Anaerolineae bacterium]
MGKTRVLRVWQNLAIGRTYYPDMARSQVHGAVIQGIGYALYEEKVLDKATGQNRDLCPGGSHSYGGRIAAAADRVQGSAAGWRGVRNFRAGV